LNNVAGGILYSGLSVCEGVSASVYPKTLSTSYIRNQWVKTAPNFGRWCNWVHRYVDSSLESKGQRSRSQQAEV